MSYLPYDINSDVTVDPAHIQANDAALDNAISSNLTELNLSSATRIPNSMLASPNVEETLELRFCAEVGIDGTGQAPTSPSNKDVIRISGSATYTILGISYVVVNTTATTASSTLVSVVAGNYSGTNTWNTTSTLVTAVAVDSQAIVNSCRQGDFTLATSSFAAPNQLALRFTQTGTNHAMNMVVTLRVTRSLQ